MFVREWCEDFAWPSKAMHSSDVPFPMQPSCWRYSLCIGWEQGQTMKVIWRFFARVQIARVQTLDRIHRWCCWWWLFRCFPLCHKYTQCCNCQQSIADICADSSKTYRCFIIVDLRGGRCGRPFFHHKIVIYQQKHAVHKKFVTFFRKMFCGEWNVV